MTVLCEGDPDSRFFSAVGSTMAHGGNFVHPSEVNFVPVGGKARFPVALRALRAIGVSTRVLADFDLVRDKNDLARLAAIADRDWTDYESDWKTGVRPIADSGSGVPIDILTERITTILREADPSSLQRQKRRSTEFW
jgi:hypothetical protein